MRFKVPAIAAALLLGGFSSAQAQVFHFGYDPAATSAGTAPNSAAAFAAFSAVGSVGTETFDSYVMLPDPLSYQSVYTASPLGITFGSNWSFATSQYPSPVISGTATGFYSDVLAGSNTGLTDVFQFSSPIYAFGTNMINIGDALTSTTLSITVDLGGTDVRTYDFAPFITFANGGYNATGFAGLTLGAPFDRVTITRGGSGGDILAYNSISVSAVPEPGTWALLASAAGMAGYFGLRRRRHQAVA